MEIVAIILAVLVPIVAGLYLLTKAKIAKLNSVLATKEREFSKYKLKAEHLKQYEIIDDAKVEASRIVTEANSKLSQVESTVQSELKEAREKAKEIRGKAEAKLIEAHDLATKIEENAKNKAEEIAGDAWEARQNAEHYQSTVKAMKNIIKGYGDEYLIPNRSVLDDLAAEYDHKEAGQELMKIRTLLKSMIRNDEAADCEYVEAYRRSTAIEFALDAFNGKVDTIMSKVKYDVGYLP